MIYELDDYSTMSDEDIKEWVLDNYDWLFYFFNPDADEYEQVYRVRSFFTAGLVPGYAPQFSNVNMQHKECVLNQHKTSWSSWNGVHV